MRPLERADVERSAPPSLDANVRSHLTWWAVALPLAVVLGLAHLQARPFVGNQNQYLVHAVGPRLPTLADDWLVGTADPYPFFTWLASGVLDLGGLDALRIWGVAWSVTGILGVGFVARPLTPSRSSWPSWVAMAVAAVTLVPAVSAGWRLTGFHGLAGQYLLSVPGYAQPASAGVALLFAVGLLLRANGLLGRGRWTLVAIAGAVVAVACAVHPTYAVVVAVAVLAAAVVDLTLRTRHRLPAYGAVGSAGMLAALVANPALLAVGSSISAGSDSLSRFAFDRIPQHTLISEWRWSEDWLVVLTIMVGALVAPHVRLGRWMSRWLALSLAVSLAAAFVVWATRWTSLALLFPWRVTALLMPIALAVIVVWAAKGAQQAVDRAPPAVRRSVLVGSTLLMAAAVTLLAVLGVERTRSAPAPASQPAVRAVVAADPAGVGLIPVAAENVRLNAGYPVFVDWKSPPYASADLDEWWRRVDDVRAVESDLALLCGPEWEQRIDWVLVRHSAAIPDCLREWSAVHDGTGWRVLVKP